MPALPWLTADLTITGNCMRRGNRARRVRSGNTANAGTGMRCQVRICLLRALSPASVMPRGLQPV
jgi:hypothetical protein